MKRGYADLYERVTAASSDLEEQLARLQAEAERGAHPDDVAAARSAIWAAHGYNATAGPQAA